MASAFAVEPISEDDAFLADALTHASVPTLMMSLVHLTGSAAILEGGIRPGPAMMGDADQGLGTEEKARIRAMALDALRAYRDGGCVLPPAPSSGTVWAMMSFLVGQEVPRRYVPMMMEELALDGSDPRDVAWEGVSPADRAARRVLVIGAGMSGLLAAARLEEAGIPYVVIEKNDAVGGTWLENRYPGCRVDVGNHFYCYSFGPHHAWPEYFSQRDALQGYFDRCATEFRVRPHIRFGTQVVAARFDEAAGSWSVIVRGPEGVEETLVADAVISAVGQLNRPKLPDIPGRDTFHGRAFHSACWPSDVALDGQRVAVIGTGASAFQLVPEVAKVARRVAVFQRSAPWMVPNPRYHERVSPQTQWLLAHVPYYARWYRFLLFWPGSDGLMPALEIDPDWSHPERSVNAINDGMRQMFVQYMAEQVGDDADLLAKVTPDYPPFGKRMLQDNGSWLGTLGRDDVDLVTTPIAAITPNGVRCTDGSTHDVDVIVYATGFHANRFLWPMEIVGRDGRVLSEVWGDDPRAYLGMTMPGFPNFFCLYGPGTNLAHAGSIIFHAECQVRYVMGCLAALWRDGQRTIECRDDVMEAYYERFTERHERIVWSHPGMRNWYKNAAGKVTTTSPWLLVEYWEWTKTPNLADFVLS